MTNRSRSFGAPPSKPIALDDFSLRFKGPLSAESKHLVECPACGSVVQICG